MDLTEVLRVLRGRWYVMLPLVLLTFVAVFGVDRAVPTKYQATTTFSLLASRQAVQGTQAVPGTGNAFLSFDGSLNDMADFLVRRVDAPDSAQQLLKLGVSEAYSAELAANAEGPFITLTVTGTDRAHVSASIATLLTFSEQELTQIQTQASVAPSAMIGSIVIVPAGPPTTQLKSKVQGMIGVAAAGLVFAFLATFAVDNLAAAFARRRHGTRRTRSGRSSSRSAARSPRAPAEPAAAEPVEGAPPPQRTEVFSGLPDSRD